MLKTKSAILNSESTYLNIHLIDLFEDGDASDGVYLSVENSKVPKTQSQISSIVVLGEGSYCWIIYKDKEAELLTEREVHLRFKNNSPIVRQAPPNHIVQLEFSNEFPKTTQPVHQKENKDQDEDLD